MADKGIYVLFLRNNQLQQIEVGKLGRFEFAPGIYAYVGTAYGPGGLKARLGRHFRQEKTLRWHIDYIRATMQPVAAWTSSAAREVEHRLAELLGSLDNTRIAIEKFGASDCRCPSHLFLMQALPAQDIISAQLMLGRGAFLREYVPD